MQALIYQHQSTRTPSMSSPSHNNKSTRSSMKSPVRNILPTTPTKVAKLAYESPAKRPRREVTEQVEKDEQVRNSILTTPSSRRPVTIVVTPGTAQKKPIEESKPPIGARRKLAFHRSEIEVTENVRRTYKIVHKITGAVGGNGSFGAIYGELTVGSMQKMVDLMKKHTAFDKTSKFIDVGSGIGKPNLHVMQDPGVEFSYGIEMERSRWVLGLASLKGVLAEARRSNTGMGHKCFFEHGNIKHAKSFDPFTHVYMFSIGFPPTLWEHLSEIFNKSCSPYLICYQSPRIIIDRYDFDVELITQISTSMHGSSECHMGYLYKRITPVQRKAGCDALFREAHSLVQSGKNSLFENIASRVEKELYGGRTTRAKKIVHCVESDPEDDDEDENEEETE